MGKDTNPPHLKLVSGDGRQPPEALTAEQRAALADLLSMVFVMLRSPGYQYFWDKPEDWHNVEKLQAAVDRAVAFGEAFHNVPRFLLEDGFDFDLQEAIMHGYMRKCPDMEHLMTELRDIRNMGKSR